MWDVFIEATRLTFNLSNVGFLFIGVIVGIFFGIIPGIGGSITLALLIPITFGMDSTQALILIIAAYGACTFGGAISAILINTPGTGQNITTCFDGYPLARQGRAGYAIGAAMTASGLGGVLGLIILALMIPVAREAILAFSYPEFFLLTLVGICVIVVVAQSDLFKGLIAAGVGFLLSFIGMSPITSETRFVFDTLYLMDGIKFMPSLIGIFAIAELIKLSVEGGTIAREGTPKASRRDAMKGILAVFKHYKVFLSGSIIGVLLGMVPGIGGTVSSFVAYGQAAQMSKNRDQFGKGAIEGVIASEAANDSKEGGALLPTIIFGIPGSAGMAILIGGLLLHDIRPGPKMLNENILDTFVLITGNLYGHILAAIIAVILVPQLNRVTYIRTGLLTPIVFVLALIGSYAISYSIWDVFLSIAFGVLGYEMEKFEFPRVPLVIALILGHLIEMTFQQTLLTFGVAGFFTRPISMFLLVVALLTLALPFFQQYKRKKKRFN
jgi:putative tricarboxylic transport membrane protein